MRIKMCEISYDFSPVISIDFQAFPLKDYQNVWNFLHFSILLFIYKNI